MMTEEDYTKFLESLKSDEIAQAGVESKQCAVLEGMLFAVEGSADANSPATKMIPHTLFPTPLSSVCVAKSKQLQLALNMMIYVMGKDEEFIESSLAGSEKNDQFTRNLLDILRAKKTDQFPQLATAAILRTDYMIDHNSDTSLSATESLKQIEMNTISVAYGAHSTAVTQLHQNTLCSLLQNIKDPQRHAQAIQFLKCIPKNNTLKGITKCIRKCWMVYDENKQLMEALPAIIFVVQPGEANQYDQLKIFYLLRNEFLNENTHFVPPVYVLTIDEMVKRIELDKELGILALKCPVKSTKTEVGVVYYRSGYGPNDYTSEKVWNMRKLVEMSKAIKLPDIGSHLIGSKKFQQILATDHALVDKYLEQATDLCPDIANVTSKDIIGTFATFYSLDPQDVDVVEVTKIVRKNIENYVLKPQREGGGNNLYGKEMMGAIEEKIKNGSLSDYIIMSLIHPKIYTNYKIVNSSDRPIHMKTITELGVFGHFIVDASNIVMSNEVDGHLLRSKASTTKDGGVSAGNAVLDSPILF